MKKMFFIFIAMAVTANAEIKSPRPEISVSANIEVNSDKSILLKDIATVSFATVQQMKHIHSVVLLTAIGDGQKIFMKNSELVKLIKEKVSEVPEVADVKWTYFVSETVTIVGKRNLLPQQGVVNDLTLAIQAKCGDCKVTLRDIKIPVINSKVAYDICALDSDGIRPGGSFLVPVHCYFSGEKKTFWITGSAKVTKNGPVANRQINPGERIAQKDFRMDIVDLTFAKDGVPSSDEIKDQLAARTILLNQPIFKGDLKRELAVTRGQVIRAISGNETFEVTSQVVAEEQGHIGDMIKVKNTETQRTLSGQIVERGVVRVQ
jgi:flagellar basal body P-ring formation protein FlgA